MSTCIKTKAAYIRVTAAMMADRLEWMEKTALAAHASSISRAANEIYEATEYEEPPPINIVTC